MTAVGNVPNPLCPLVLVRASGPHPVLFRDRATAVLFGRALRRVSVGRSEVCLCPALVALPPGVLRPVVSPRSSLPLSPIQWAQRRPGPGVTMLHLFPSRGEGLDLTALDSLLVSFCLPFSCFSDSRQLLRLQKMQVIDGQKEEGVSVLALLRARSLSALPACLGLSVCRWELHSRPWAKHPGRARGASHLQGL